MVGIYRILGNTSWLWMNSQLQLWDLHCIKKSLKLVIYISYNHFCLWNEFQYFYLSFYNKASIPWMHFTGFRICINILITWHMGCNTYVFFLCPFQICFAIWWHNSEREVWNLLMHPMAVALLQTFICFPWLCTIDMRLKRMDFNSRAFACEFCVNPWSSCWSWCIRRCILVHWSSV